MIRRKDEKRRTRERKAAFNPCAWIKTKNNVFTSATMNV